MSDHLDRTRRIASQMAGLHEDLWFDTRDYVAMDLSRLAMESVRALERHLGRQEREERVNDAEA